jgi:hypothetical protein
MKSGQSQEPLVIYVDVDETICDTPDNPRDYTKAVPRKDAIEKINRLYDAGHKIIYWTARGSRTRIDWLPLTIQQLDEWGAKYSGVSRNKPYYDLLIDDKSLSSVSQIQGSGRW